MISTYTPTLMEKLLGRNYKWWFLLQYKIKANTSYKVDTFMWGFGQFLILFSSLTVWYINFKISDNLENFGTVAGYFILGTILSNLLKFNSRYFVSSHIANGKITTFLMYPQSTIQYYFFYAFGSGIFQSIITITSIIIMLPVWFRWFHFPASWFHLLASLVLVLVSVILFFFVDFIMGSIAFWTIEINGINVQYNTIKEFFSGKLFPLSFIFTNPIYILINPFAYFFYFPIQVYLGEYGLQQTILVFLGGIAWCLVLYFLAKLVFKAGLKRNESVGL